MSDVDIFHIWEDDWIYKQDIIKSMIKNKLGLSNKIYARKCEVRLVNAVETKKFLNDNHLQGYVASKYKLGLYFNNELVSLMTFGKSRNKKNQMELLRFCNKLNTSVIGGASKLFKSFLRQYHTEFNTLISYANKDHSNGNLYHKLGFKYVKDTKPGYHWVVDGIRENRFKYRKSELVKKGFNSELSESEIMHSLGYYRIYNTGNIYFELNFIQTQVV